MSDLTLKIGPRRANGITLSTSDDYARGEIWAHLSGSEEMARRIVAAVNACAGIETEGLEEGVEYGGMRAVAEGFFKVQKDRDELMAALKEAFRIAKINESRWTSKDQEDWEQMVMTTPALIARIEAQRSQG